MRVHKSLLCVTIILGCFSLCQSIIPGWLTYRNPSENANDKNELSFDRVSRKDFIRHCPNPDVLPCRYGEHAYSYPDCPKCLKGPAQTCVNDGDCGKDGFFENQCCQGLCRGCMTTPDRSERCDESNGRLKCSYDNYLESHVECYLPDFCYTKLSKEFVRNNVLNE